MNKKCPNCGQFKIVNNRFISIIFGIGAMVLGGFLILIPPIGIFILLVGLGTLIVGGLFLRGYQCLNCGWKGKSLEPNQDQKTSP